MKIGLVLAVVLGSGSLLAGVAYFSSSSKESVSSEAASSNNVVLKDEAKRSVSVSNVFPVNVKSVKDIRKAMAIDWTTEDLLYSVEQEASCATGDEKSIYIRYVSHYPDNPKGAETFIFTDVKIPPTEGDGFKKKTPLITEKVLRGESEWKRNHYKLWWYGKNQKNKKEQEAELERMKERLDVLTADYGKALELAVETENLNVMSGPEATALFAYQKVFNEQMRLTHFDNSVKTLNEKIYERVEVRNPPPVKSFRYNNVEKRGDYFKVAETKFRKNEIRQYYESLDEDSRDELTTEVLDILQPLQDLGETIVDAGQKTILGYSCEMKRIPDWDSETCSHNFSGLGNIMLKTRVSKRVTEAVYVLQNPCVPDSQFIPPSDVKFE